MTCRLLAYFASGHKALDSKIVPTTCKHGEITSPQAAGLLGDQGRGLGPRGRGDAMGGAAMGALRGLRGLGTTSSLAKKNEKTVAAAKELNGFLQGFVEQVGGGEGVRAEPFVYFSYEYFHVFEIAAELFAEYAVVYSSIQIWGTQNLILCPRSSCFHNNATGEMAVGLTWAIAEICVCLVAMVVYTTHTPRNGLFTFL